jgi:tetratricopeptide (TPR) repeat protein
VRRSPQLARQWTLFDRAQHERALQQARTLLPRLRGADRQEAYRLIGLCYGRQKKHSEALDWLKRACEGSSNAQVWLDVALAGLKVGEWDLAEDAFEQVRLCQQVARYAQPPGFYLQLFWYAGSMLDAAKHRVRDKAQSRPVRGEKRALEQVRSLVDELAAAYRKLHVTETTFLFTHSMPFLSSFLTLATRLFRAQWQLLEGVTWLRGFAEELDRGGKAQVESAIQALERVSIERQRKAGESCSS